RQAIPRVTAKRAGVTRTNPALPPFSQSRYFDPNIRGRFLRREPAVGRVKGAAFHFALDRAELFHANTSSFWIELPAAAPTRLSAPTFVMASLQVAKERLRLRPILSNQVTRQVCHCSPLGRCQTR